MSKNNDGQASDGDAASMRRLWCAVIVAAIEDAQGTADIVPTRRRMSNATSDRASLDWLTTPNSDFDHVASLAGLDPDATRERLRELLRRAPQGPSDRQAAGVAEDFQGFRGTGAPQGAQDRTKIEFSE
jgi:hypothetical protein